MNPYKLRAIIENIRARGRLPTDQFGNTLSPADLVVWFELDDCLSPEEKYALKWELVLMTEAQTIIDQLRRKAS